MERAALMLMLLRERITLRSALVSLKTYPIPGMQSTSNLIYSRLLFRCSTASLELKLCLRARHEERQRA